MSLFDPDMTFEEKQAWLRRKRMMRPVPTVDEKIEKLKEIASHIEKAYDAFGEMFPINHGLGYNVTKKLVTAWQDLSDLRFEMLGRLAELERKHPPQVQNIPRNDPRFDAPVHHNCRTWISAKVKGDVRAGEPVYLVAKKKTKRKVKKKATKRRSKR